jgi:hypothetical protein
MQPKVWFIAMNKWLQLRFKQRVVICGNFQSTYEIVCGIIENTKLCPNISMTSDGEEILLKQLSILVIGCCSNKVRMLPSRM